MAIVCGLDLGGVRVGVALSDDLGLYAHPRPPLPARPEPALLAALLALTVEEGVDTFVVGLPLDMKGGEGDAAKKARRLAQAIANTTKKRIVLWDERLTTVEGARRLRESEVKKSKMRANIDAAAAVTLLQSWLDSKRSGR